MAGHKRKGPVPGEFGAFGGPYDIGDGIMSNSLIADRYQVTPPVRGGYAWWDVRDSYHNNFVLATFSIHMKNAEKMAKALATELNQTPAGAQT